jgi:predicted ATPase/DNA-binding SARP family transcriptional activator
MRDKLQLTLFGSPEVRCHGQVVTGFRSSKAQALLYCLAVTGRPHTRATLAGLLWGDQPETAARASLSKCLSNLRDLVGDALLIERQTVAFNRDYPYQLDTEHFATSLGALPTAERIQRLPAALALYRGDFLEGFYVRDAPDFEQWLLVQRAHYREAVIQGLHTLANDADQQGDLPQAITYTRRLLTLEPWREEAHRQLMTQLARSGQRAAALAQFETCRRILDEELAVEPDAETMALVEAIRTDEFDKVTRWQGDKLKNVPDNPVTLSPPHPVMSNLPVSPTPLIGRERELVELGELISNPQCRLITITGPGGMGKTRLALAAAAEQSRKFQHGALFVSLTGLSSADFLPQAILAALNIPLQGTLSPQQQVRASLYNQARLVVLDNYEHLLPDVELLLDMLHYAPGITLLVTSRERLALQAEYLVEMSGLDYPPDQSTQSGTKSELKLASYAAIQLFLQRVRQTQPRFNPSIEEMAAIVRICRISEGMPLALELAAAVAREQPLVALATTLEEGQARLVTRLRDLPERHRSMGALFAYSWRLLSAAEQQVLAALSLFRGGFAVEAAQAVANATPAILAGLMDKSWLRCNQHGRYDLHELVRQYVYEQLVESGEFDAVRNIYTQHFLRFTDEVKSGTEGAEPTKWMTRVEQDIDNLRAVLKWLSLHAPEDGLCMILNLYWLWQSRSYLHEGRDWLAVMLAHSVAISPSIRAEAYDRAGFLAVVMNQIEEAQALFSQSLALYRQLDLTDQRVAGGMAHALNHLGVVALFRGDFEQAVQLCYQALAIAQRSGVQMRASSALFFAGEAFYLQGLLVQSKRSYEESLRLCDADFNLREHGHRVGRLGHVICAQGDLVQAHALFAKGLMIASQCYDLVGSGMALIGLARAAAVKGDYSRAAMILAAKEALTTINPIVRYWPMDRQENERTLTLIHAHLDEAAFAAAWTEGCAMSVELAVAYALADPIPQ